MKQETFDENLHLFVKSVVENKGVSHTQPVWLHRVKLAIVKVSHLSRANEGKKKRTNIQAITNMWIIKCSKYCEMFSIHQ